MYWMLFWFLFAFKSSLISEGGSVATLSEHSSLSLISGIVLPGSEEECAVSFVAGIVDKAMFSGRTTYNFFISAFYIQQRRQKRKKKTLSHAAILARGSPCTQQHPDIEPERRDTSLGCDRPPLTLSLFIDHIYPHQNRVVHYPTRTTTVPSFFPQNPIQMTISLMTISLFTLCVTLKLIVPQVFQ